MKRRPFTTLVILSFVVLAGCDGGQLRGSVAPSEDGRTYLAIVDDNGASCDSLLLDGEPWAYKIGEPGLVAPGWHRIECDGGGVSSSSTIWGP
jgi:hypothetical protein